jgi:hypothetical protein
MNLKRWFAWFCLVLTVGTEIFLFRALREKDAAQTDARAAKIQMRAMQTELDELKKTDVGQQAAEISRLRKQNEIFTNKLAALQASILPLVLENQSNAQHLATARTALQLQQRHLQELENLDNQIVTASSAVMDASAAVIAKKTCLHNLRLIDDAKQQWAVDNKKPDSAVPSEKNLSPYLKNGVLPVCPSGGIYLINAVGELPTCSVTGHALTE